MTTPPIHYSSCLLAAFLAIHAMHGERKASVQMQEGISVGRDLPIKWGDDTWRLAIDPVSGALVHLENQHDPQHMNWLRDAGRWNGRDWIAAQPERATLDGQWGLVETSHTGLMHVAQVRKVSDRIWEAEYTSEVLTVLVRRELHANGDLDETYTLKNTGNITMDLPAGSVSITAPLFDQYPDAKLSRSSRCHAHLWMGGSSAWINAVRMGMEAPHLGLVLTNGSLESYSQRGGTFNDRGMFLLHPGAMRLDPGKSTTLSWRLFWHQGWEDFFAKSLETPGFVRLTAREYTVTAGQSIEISAESSSFKGVRVTANGRQIDANPTGNRLQLSIPTEKPGDMLVELNVGSKKTWLRGYVTPPIDAQLDARVKFIVRRQQRNKAGDPLDGAYLIYDNDTGQQVYDGQWADHNAARERLAMGELAARYFTLCKDPTFKVELKASLERYSAFLAREIEDENGVVYQTLTRKDKSRLYNFPWEASYHLAMYEAMGDTDQLDRFVRVLRSYYAMGGAQHYAIGMPIFEGLKVLKQAGRLKERDELLGYFRQHAQTVLHNGADYPRSEVNYEQAIVAPSVLMLAEMYASTGDLIYLEGAKKQMPLLEAFCGKQPDARLNEVAIRHWDDYWFGKERLYGDTFPHYWSTLNGLAYAWYGHCTMGGDWMKRAEAVMKANLSLFNPDGSASCAHLYSRTTNGHPGAKNDPWANDQDWALVNLIQLKSIPQQQLTK